MQEVSGSENQIKQKQKKKFAVPDMQYLFKVEFRRLRWQTHLHHYPLHRLSIFRAFDTYFERQKETNNTTHDVGGQIPDDNGRERARKSFHFPLFSTLQIRQLF